MEKDEAKEKAAIKNKGKSKGGKKGSKGKSKSYTVTATQPELQWRWQHVLDLQSTRTYEIVFSK